MLRSLGTVARPRRTRVWLTIAARRVDPSELLETTAADLGIRTGESIAFDGASAALELRIGLRERRHGARDPLRIAEADRDALASTIRSIARVHTVQDIILESHVAGHEGVDGVRVLPLHALLALVESDQLEAAVRYITDREANPE
jgi:hypothetical protein